MPHRKGAPVLLVHGAGGGFDQAWNSDAMAEHGFTVIAMSRFDICAPPARRRIAHGPGRRPRVPPRRVEIARAAILGARGRALGDRILPAHAGRCSAMVLLVPAFFPPGALQVRAQPSFMFESVLGSDFFSG